MGKYINCEAGYIEEGWVDLNKAFRSRSKLLRSNWESGLELLLLSKFPETIRKTGEVSFTDMVIFTPPGNISLSVSQVPFGKVLSDLIS